MTDPVQTPNAPPPVVAAGAGTPQTPSTPPALQAGAQSQAPSAPPPAPDPAPKALEVVMQEVKKVRFNHHVPGATFIQSISQGVHAVHVFVGGYLEVHPVEDRELFEELVAVSRQRGSGITMEDQAEDEDPSIRQAAQDVLTGAARSMEKITGKTIGQVNLR